MDNLSPWSSVLAISQWGGRGQLRRSWTSLAGNIFAVLLLPWPPGPQSLSKDLTAMTVAYALIRSFEQLGVKLELKWPNDLLLDGKVGGILIEERNNTLLAGIGINLASAPDAASTDQPAARLLEHLPGKGPLSLWLELSEGIRRCFTQELAHLDQLAVVSLMNNVLAWKGEKVLLVNREDKDTPLGEPCTLVGLTPNGELYVAPQGHSVDNVAELLVVAEGSLVRAM